MTIGFFKFLRYSIGCNWNWIGDGYCDDDTNTEECDWDGGDSCGDEYEDANTIYCSVCACHEDSVTTTTTTTAAATPTTTTTPTTTHIAATGPGTKCIKPSFDK